MEVISKVTLSEQQINDVINDVLDQDDTFIKDYLGWNPDSFERFILPFIKEVCSDEDLSVLKKELNNIILERDLNSLRI